MNRYLFAGLVSLSQFETSDSGGVFTSPDSVWISDAPDPYPSTVEVTGLAGSIVSVQVQLRHLAHDRFDDMDLLLVSPSGTAVMILSDVGGSSPNSGIDITVVDRAEPMPVDAPISSGTYGPTDARPDEVLPSPAPDPPYATTLSVFSGESPNGTWNLYAYDDYYFDYGSLDSWSLTIQTGPLPEGIE